MPHRATGKGPATPAPLRRLLRESVGTDGLLLFLVALLTFVWFPNDLANTNARSRLFLTLSIVERGSISLGDYGPLTVDRAERDGRSYSDKAPGMAVLALPAVALLHPYLAGRRDGVACRGPDCWFQGDKPTGRYLALQYAAILMAAPLVAAAIVLFRAFLVVLYDDCRAATLMALTLALATPLGAWATTFFEHAMATSLMIVAIVAAHAVTRLALARPTGWLAGLAVGTPLALAVPFSYPGAVAGALIALYAAWSGREAGPRWLASATLGAAAAGALVAIPLLAYNTAAFGGPLSIGYGSVVGFEGMSRGLFGIVLPDPAVVWRLLVPEFRGLIWVAPVVLLYPVGLILLLARYPALRGLGVLSAGLLAYYLMLNAGYVYWDGGHSLGPRHLTPTLPFLLLAVAAVPAVWGSRGVIVTAVLAGLGGCVVLMAIVTGNVTPANEIARPITEAVVPAFLDGTIYTVVSRALDGAGWPSFLAYVGAALGLVAALLARNGEPVRHGG